MNEKDINSDKKLDLRGVSCPLNFVKTKLKLEEMQPGQILEIILDDGESIRNVPRSVKEEGHQIIKVVQLDEENIFKLYIKKEA